MGVLKIMLVLSFSGMAFWVVNTYVPLTPKAKAIVNPILAVLLCFLLFYTWGTIDHIT